MTGGLRGLGTDFAAYVRGELGYRPAANVALFAFGEAATATGFTPAWQSGVGARVTW